MEDLLSLSSLISLVTLALMEVVLGIDNVIFVSIVMGRLPEDQHPKARRYWMFTGIAVRVALLSVLSLLVKHGEAALFSVMGYGFGMRDLIMLGGGLFLIFKTVSEIHEKLEGEKPHLEKGQRKGKGSFASVMGQIVLVDMVFSFDSMITAVGLAKHVEIMIVAVVIAMFIMFVFAEKISSFIHKHPTLKMLALSFLVLVGFMLFYEGLEPIHHSHVDKGYVYFAMAFAFGVEMLNMRMRKQTKPVELHEVAAKETH